MAFVKSVLFGAAAAMALLMAAGPAPAKDAAAPAKPAEATAGLTRPEGLRPG